MNNIRQIITERLENAHNDHRRCLEEIDYPMFRIDEIKGSILAYQDCLNLIDEYTPKIVTKQLSVKEIETLLQDLNKPHQFIIDKPAPRTEADILKDFEKLGYKVVCNNDLRIKLENNGDILTISKVSRWYSCKRYANNNTYDEISVPIAMQEHKLLNELFIYWGWL